MPLDSTGSEKSKARSRSRPVKSGAAPAPELPLWARQQRILTAWLTSKSVRTTTQSGLKPTDSLFRIVHEANVWIRACKHNVICMFDDFGLDFFYDEGMDWVYNPPQAFLDAAPAAAMASMRRSLSSRRPLMQALLSDDDRAALMTAKQHEAERRLRQTGRALWDAFLEGTGVLSPDDTDNCSWVVWALEAIEMVLYRVAWHGVPLSSFVPRNLDMSLSHDWRKSSRYVQYVRLSQWLSEHSEWLGEPVVRLFRRARSQVVEATLLTCLPPLVQPQKHQQQEQPNNGKRRQELVIRTRRQRKGQAVAVVRDVVFAQLGLVRHIASFC